MAGEEKTLLQRIQQQFGDFVVTLVVFVKGFVTTLFFAWILSKTPWVCELVGIDTNNVMVKILLTAGDIGSVAYGIISIWKDLKLLFFS